MAAKKKRKASSRKAKSKGHAPGWVVAKRARWALAKLKSRHIPLDLPKGQHHASDSKS